MKFHLSAFLSSNDSTSSSSISTNMQADVVEADSDIVEPFDENNNNNFIKGVVSSANLQADAAASKFPFGSAQHMHTASSDHE